MTDLTGLARTAWEAHADEPNARVRFLRAVRDTRVKDGIRRSLREYVDAVRAVEDEPGRPDLRGELVAAHARQVQDDLDDLTRAALRVLDGATTTRTGQAATSLPAMCALADALDRITT